MTACLAETDRNLEAFLSPAHTFAPVSLLPHQCERRPAPGKNSSDRDDPRAVGAPKSTPGEGAHAQGGQVWPPKTAGPTNNLRVKNTPVAILIGSSLLYTCCRSVHLLRYPCALIILPCRVCSLCVDVVSPLAFQDYKNLSFPSKAGFQRNVG